MKQLTPDQKRQNDTQRRRHQQIHTTTTMGPPQWQNHILMEQKQRRPKPGEKITHMGKCSLHRNESCRRKERNGKSNRHQRYEVEKNKLPQRQAPHLRRTQSLSRPHLERQKKMARIHPQKPSGYTHPPYRIVHPHYTSHLHKNHGFLHT